MGHFFTGSVIILPALMTFTASPVWSGGTAPKRLHSVKQASPTQADLADISCASTSECFAVGAGGTIVHAGAMTAVLPGKAH